MAKAILPENAAVLLLRMSSAKQDKSIPAQRDELVKLAKRKGYRIVREYVDEAISGDDTESRDGFLRLRQDCEAGPDFGIILCWHEDRLSRNDPLELGYWLKPIRDAGVVVETPTGRVDWDSLGGRLIYLIGQEMRHDYLRQLSRNVTRGFMAAAKNMQGTGGAPPRGYKHVKAIGADGKVVGVETVVVPEEAALRRRIADEYLKPDASIRSVVDLLNRSGIRTALGKKWSTSTVRDVLTNEKYTGSFVRFRYRCGRYHGVKDGEIVSRRKEDGAEAAEPVVVPDHHEAIIPREIFDRVQAKLARQKGRTAHRTGNQYIFSGLLRCGDCGGPMGGAPARDGSRRTEYLIYRCRAYQSLGRSACHCNTVAEHRLLDAVVLRINAELLSDKAIDRLLAKFRKRLAARRRGAPLDEDRLRQRIENLTQQIDRGVERVLSAPEALIGTIYAKIERLREDRDRLRDQLQAAETQQDGSGGDLEEKVETAAAALRNLRQAFRDDDPANVRDLLSSIVSSIRLDYSHDSSGKRQRHICGGGEIFVRPSDPALSLMFGTSATRPTRPS